MELAIDRFVVVVVVVVVKLGLHSIFAMWSVIGVDCQDIKKRGYSKGDGMYWLDPDGGSTKNAFQAYCDMTSYNGGWTMCYTTADKAKPRTEVTYNPQLLYGSDG